MLPPTALGRISREQFKRALRNFKDSSETISLTNAPDTTSPAASIRLQNALKYCTKVRKTGPVGRVD